MNRGRSANRNGHRKETFAGREKKKKPESFEKEFERVEARTKSFKHN